jgi:hypothetical protein
MWAIRSIPMVLEFPGLPDFREFPEFLEFPDFPSRPLAVGAQVLRQSSS